MERGIEKEDVDYLERLSLFEKSMDHLREEASEYWKRAIETPWPFNRGHSRKARNLEEQFRRAALEAGLKEDDIGDFTIF